LPTVKPWAGSHPGVDVESRAAQPDLLDVAAPTPIRPDDTHQFRLGNRPPLTGIRAPVVLAVLVYHSNFTSLPGAWASVQVFFVLSGFLITSLLAREGSRRGRISLKRFYARRTARLLPPLALTVGLLAIYASFVPVADASQRVWGDSAAALFYYADYRQAFGHAPFFGYLAQTWSLSVEEQFYVAWSVLMVVSVWLRRRGLAYAFALLGLVASTGDRLWVLHSAAHYNGAVFSRAYYAFDTRADALLVGCLLGLLATDGFLDGWGARTKGLLAVAAALSGAFLIWILLYAPLSSENVLIWWLPATSVAFVFILVYLITSPQGWGSKALGIGVLVFIGELSYTLYLVHFPVFLALTPSVTHWSFWPTEVLRLVIVFAISAASWFAIERPLMRWRRRSELQ
jgi:peptidoglycan/LPS O-acetylase OafA/YrhL